MRPIRTALSLLSYRYIRDAFFRPFHTDYNAVNSLDVLSRCPPRERFKAALFVRSSRLLLCVASKWYALPINFMCWHLSLVHGVYVAGATNDQGFAVVICIILGVTEFEKIGSVTLHFHDFTGIVSSGPNWRCFTPLSCVLIWSPGRRVMCDQSSNTSSRSVSCRAATPWAVSGSSCARLAERHWASLIPPRSQTSRRLLGPLYVAFNNSDLWQHSIDSIKADDFACSTVFVYVAVCLRLHVLHPVLHRRHRWTDEVQSRAVDNHGHAVQGRHRKVAAPGAWLLH